MVSLHIFFQNSFEEYELQTRKSPNSRSPQEYHLPIWNWYLYDYDNDKIDFDEFKRKLDTDHNHIC